ncbi:MAG: HD domain-containing protein [Phycisphaerales bacterium]|nr:MAG: HD domain-containing protein [Phycisphaerales bacterium]
MKQAVLHENGRSLTSCQLRELEEFGNRVSGFGVNVAVASAEGEVLLVCEGGRFRSCPKQLAEYCGLVLDEHGRRNGSGAGGPPVWRFGDRNLVLGTILQCAAAPSRPGDVLGVVLIDLGDVGACSDGRPSRDGADSASPQTGGAYLMEVLRLLAENFQVSTRADEQIEMIGTELSQTYEELVLLHKLGTNMRVTEEDAGFLQMACDSLTETVLVEGIAVLLDKTIDDEQKLVVAAGSGLIDIDDRTAATLHARMVEEIRSGKEALLDSEVDSPFKYEWPENIKNVVAVPLCGKDKSDAHLGKNGHSGPTVIGLMVAINRIDKQDFDSIDVKLFNSVASSCAVFIENGRLFKDLKELFIGSLKALTNSIDAKDQYTRGHSERVAIISRWIAERLAETEPIDEEQIHRIYLAGLLHDIGKIGIDEVMLRKEGALTEQERDRIRKHPSIGAGILREIRQMRDIVPGVLCHHERMDGRGYPKGLTADQIPLIGKIVGLADSFDAMTSKRTYRDARTVEQAIAEIEKGLDTQFDRKVAEVFIASDIYRLWDIMQGGPALAGRYGAGAFAEYETAAVGTLVR